MSDDTKTVAKPDFRPLYAQIQTLITRRIGDGTWKPGDLLPTEMEIAAEYGVSQGTVRKALIALEREKLIVRRQGVGTYVARHARDTTLFHFFRMVEENGARLLPRSRILRQSIRRPTREQAARLAIDCDTKIHVVVRLRYLHDAPAIYEELFAPLPVVPSLDLPKGVEMDEEMYVIYQEHHNILIARVEEKLQAIAAESKEATLLRVALGTPLLEIVRIAYDVNGRPIELRISRCDTRAYRYAADIY